MARVKVLVPAGAVLAAILTAIGQFKTDDGLFTRIGPELGAWGVELVAIVIASAIVWLVGQRATRPDGKPAVPALVLAILSVLSIPAFWLGLPSVFAAGAAALGMEARDRGASALGIVSIVLAALAVAVAVFAAFAG